MGAADSKPKHTPGPWTIFAWMVCAPDSELALASVRGVSTSPAEDTANARLIAASPDLLAALQEVSDSTAWKWLSSKQRKLVNAAIRLALTGERS